MIGRRVGCQRRQPTPRPSSPLAGASEPARRSQPTPSPPAGGHTNAPSATVPRRLLPRNRARETVTALAKEFGVSFDCVARRIIAAGTRRDQLPPRRAGRRPAELDSDEWLGAQLAGGAGVGDLSRRLHVTPPRRSAMRSATTRHSAPNAPPVLGQYWPIRSTGAFRWVRGSPAPLSNGGPASKLGDAPTPSRRRRELSAAPPHSIVTNLVTIVVNRSRTLDARASGTTARAVGHRDGDEDGGRPQPPILASSRPRPATADCNIVATALGVTSSERTPQTRDASPDQGRGAERNPGLAPGPRRQPHPTTQVGGETMTVRQKSSSTARRV